MTPHFTKRILLKTGKHGAIFHTGASSSSMKSGGEQFYIDRGCCVRQTQFI